MGGPAFSEFSVPMVLRVEWQASVEVETSDLLDPLAGPARLAALAVAVAVAGGAERAQIGQRQRQMRMCPARLDMVDSRLARPAHVSLAEDAAVAVAL